MRADNSRDFGGNFKVIFPNANDSHMRAVAINWQVLKPDLTPHLNCNLSAPSDIKHHESTIRPESVATR